ncbi:Mitochondrial translation optimization protein 1 [Cyberlindnera fabianii]|uniref:Mitochondrial translation optimization protein 1 n=1 Tax=Cyberlindnera fabianii TaxID=36022 RepID=A0A1V2KYI9_CYBFA|nr:Mitochondrial translation optimization protein 1 [Cyberlindnera fabianii]
MLRFNNVTGDMVIKSLSGQYQDIPRRVLNKIEIDGKYSPYVHKQRDFIKAFQSDESLLLPLKFDYTTLASLSNESRDILNKVQPRQLVKLDVFKVSHQLCFCRWKSSVEMDEEG